MIIALAIFIRSLNFSDSLNFSSDQAKFSLKAVELWENREISLIGPSISLNLDGREIYQGGVIYYFLLFFLLLGNFDPLTSSLLFSIFAFSAAIPFYFGLKLLLDKEKALAGTAVYLLLPIFINYTSFLWNPNFQLALMPFLFLLFWLFKKYNRGNLLLISGIWLGLLIQFHYQLVLGLLMILVWLRLYLKISFSQVLIFLLGIVVGFLPILIYEFRNNFYNLNSLIYLLQHLGKLEKSGSLISHQHYYISLVLIGLVLCLSWVKAISGKVLILMIGLY